MPVEDVHDAEGGRINAALVRALRAISQAACSAQSGAINADIALSHIRMYARTALTSYGLHADAEKVDDI